MNTLEIAARNYLANVTGASPEIVDAMFIMYPSIAEEAFNTVAAVVTGPFGILASATDAEDVGYADALDDVEEMIDGFVMAVPCECAASSVHTALQAVKAGIEILAEDVIEEDHPLLGAFFAS